MQRKSQIKVARARKAKPARRIRSPHDSCPVVGIGASAGGLEAITKLLQHLPANTGMAFVLVQHLDPTHESALTEILSRATAMPVTQVKDGMAVKPNQVYVIPPNTEMAMLHGRLSLLPRAGAANRAHLPIDYFFQSLAEDQRARSIGVILSGNASDGTLGLKAIKAKGGITFAQDQKTAKYTGMPRSAVASGCVDCVMAPERIAQELARIGRHPFLALSTKAMADPSLVETDDDLKKIFILLRAATGLDFSDYKHTTIKRRILRRMLLHQIDRMDRYVRLLNERPEEVEALYDDILIHVTSFFRDRATFDILQKRYFPRMLKRRAAGAPLRVWVPGCSTGEEAYSLAISLLECAGPPSGECAIQIFATDVSEEAIEKARAGWYPESIAADVSAERLRRYFLKREQGYQITNAVRELCVFARQNVLRDPPFSRLDLISCRNLLIYLGANLQKKLFPIFHYSLKPEGMLMLGSSESAGNGAGLFSLIDRKHKIYARKSVRNAHAFLYPDEGPQEKPSAAVEARRRRTEDERVVVFDPQKEADRLVLNAYAPPGVLINEAMEILQFRGQTGPYLEPAPGEASLNLLKMARESLMVELRSAVLKAKKTRAQVERKGVEFTYSGRQRTVNLSVIPIRGASARETHFLVLFAETRGPAAAEPPGAQKAKPAGEARRNDQLRRELAATREYLESIIREQESTNEALRSANEEVQSGNEELQSTNEELETAKEELQATNEELTTVNEEVQNRNSELNQLNNDLINLLGSVNIPIVMLGTDLRIRRYTPVAEKVLNLIASDIGRPISDLKPRIDVPDLETLVIEVVDTLTITQREVRDSDGRWYSLVIRPYRTSENRIEGAVLALLDIDAIRKTTEELEIAHNYAQGIVETMREPLIVLDRELRVQVANPAFRRTFQVSAENILGKPVYGIGNGQWNIPRLRALLEEVLPQNTVVQDFAASYDFPEGGRKQVLLNARRLTRDGRNADQILLTVRETESQGSAS